MFTINPSPDGTGQTSSATLLHGFVSSLYRDFWNRKRAIRPEQCIFLLFKQKKHKFSPTSQVRLRDIDGNKLPNGEHPAIHWNRLDMHKKSSHFDITDTYLQVSEAVGDGVES